MFSNMLTVFKRCQALFASALFLAMMVYSIGCSNALTSFANKETDISLYYTALEAIRDGRYDDAIDTCGDFSEDYLERSEVIEVCASAYAGSCGYTTLSMAEFLGDYPATTPKLFPYLLALIPDSSATDSAHCNAGVALLRTLGDADERTDDQNAFMILLSLQTIATVLKEAGDIDNNEVIDVGFLTCSGISAAQSQQIGLAFYELDKSLDELSSSALYTVIDGVVDALCTALTALGQDLCNAANPGTLIASELKGARSLMHEGAVVGVDEDVNGATVATSNCP